MHSLLHLFSHVLIRLDLDGDPFADGLEDLDALPPVDPIGEQVERRERPILLEHLEDLLTPRGQKLVVVQAQREECAIGLSQRK